MSLSGSFEGKATRFPAAGGVDDHRPRLPHAGGERGWGRVGALIDRQMCTRFLGQRASWAFRSARRKQEMRWLPPAGVQQIFPARLL